jgi:hypothetical protein
MSEPSPLAQKLAGVHQFPKKTPTDIQCSHIPLSRSLFRHQIEDCEWIARKLAENPLIVFVQF